MSTLLINGFIVFVLSYSGLTKVQICDSQFDESLLSCHLCTSFPYYIINDSQCTCINKIYKTIYVKGTTHTAWRCIKDVITHFHVCSNYTALKKLFRWKILYLAEEGFQPSVIKYRTKKEVVHSVYYQNTHGVGDKNVTKI
jgi:hypothetical protein